MLEGPEGAGKTTQQSMLADALAVDGYTVVTTREPGGTPLGDGVRQLLLGSDSYDMLAEAEALLLSAARAQHVHDVIRPALSRGDVVICDRFSDSSLAYQGGGRGMNVEELNFLQQIATRGVQPDTRLLLDIPVDQGLERRHREARTVNRIDTADLAFHQRVRNAYLDLVAAYPENWNVIDASGSADQVFAQVHQTVRDQITSKTPMRDAERQG